MRSAFTSRPSSIVRSRRTAWPAKSVTSGTTCHSAFQERPSRSWSQTCPSLKTAAPWRTSRASVPRCSASSGLRLWGIGLTLPTVPGGTPSLTSPSSGRCRL